MVWDNTQKAAGWRVSPEKAPMLRINLSALNWLTIEATDLNSLWSSVLSCWHLEKGIQRCSQHTTQTYNFGALLKPRTEFGLRIKNLISTIGLQQQLCKSLGALEATTYIHWPGIKK